MTEEDLQALLKNNPALKVRGADPALSEIKIKKQSKHRNKKTKVDGILFDSKKESEYYSIIKVLIQAKEIFGFVLQPRFLLQEGTEEMNPIFYESDFLVWTKQGTEIWDVKASEDYKTDVYKLKKKMFYSRYPGLKIIEKY